MNTFTTWSRRGSWAALVVTALASGCGGSSDAPPVSCNPSAELCNGVDDNCDGTIDDGDPGGGASCTTGIQGACAAGVLHCQGGAVECVQTTPSGAEVCNGLDDDCDGVVDEGFSLATDPQNCGACGNACALAHSVPQCVARTCAIATCDRGFVDLDGTPANGCEYACPVMPITAEVCNGIDDDCNGLVDDGSPGGGLACDTAKFGICGPGTTVCSGGAITCVQNEQPRAETCNGVDEDCDGMMDEDFLLGRSCTVGVGECQRAGVRICAGDGTWTCSVIAGAAVTEICGNGLDDDCDGAVDEGCPYAHTIAIDGANDFAPSESFTTTSGGYRAYVTWDADHLYVGYEGADVGSAARWLLVYLDVGTGVEWLTYGRPYGTQRASFPAGFTADHELAMRLDGSGQTTRYAWGGIWATFTPSPGLTVAVSSGAHFLEMSIPLAALGSPGVVGVTSLLLNDTSGEEWSYAGLYEDAFPDGKYAYIPISTYLLADTASALAPNDAANKRP